MPNFQPDICTFRDTVGYGAFDIGHHREHLQFIQLAAGFSPAVILPAPDLLNFLTSGTTIRAQLEAHQEAHVLLSQLSGTTALDFTQFDLSKQDDFYNFLSYHQTTHQQLRQFFGIV